MDKAFKKKFLIHIGIALLVIFVLFIVFILVGRDINRRTSKIQGFKEELVKRSQASASLVSLLSAAEKAEEYKNFLNNRLPPRDELINFSKEMTILAARNDVELGLTLGTEIDRDENGLGGLSFQMNVTSTYDNFLIYLDALHAHRYFLRLDSFDLTRKDGTVFQGVFSGRVFSQPLNQT